MRFRITDPAGVPLDREGLLTDGNVETRFVLSHLVPETNGPGHYSAYTTTSVTSQKTGNTAVQPTSDVGGAYTVVDASAGLYEYTFGVQLSNVDATQTHTVGVWAWRDVAGKRYVANTVFDFRPDGQSVTAHREIVETKACNGCHNPLKLHGGVRRDARLCVTCHSADVIDPSTNNSLDFSVMVHKIHRGASLPSVVAGKPYELTGYMGQVTDFSKVAFPQPVQQCATCHTGPDADVWKTHPTRASCGSCHDDVSFETTTPAGMKAHVGGPQATDANCSVCHTSTAAGLESIPTKHLDPFTDPASPTLAAQILSVTNTAPGQTPQMVIAVTLNGSPLDIIAQPLPSLKVTMAGPTTDYASFTQWTIQGSGATGTLTHDPLGVRYTFPSAVPTTAAGTYAFGLEGYVAPGGATGTHFAMLNPVFYAGVTDATPVPRRDIVTRDQCNSCHSDLGAHGGVRRSPEYCVFCHNPNKVNDTRVSRFEVPSTIAHSVDFRTMIHKIHMGKELSQPFVLGSYPPPSASNPAGTPVDFGEVQYPGDQRSCGTCHVAGSFALPLANGLLPTHELQFACSDANPNPLSYCVTRTVTSDTLTGPTASACLACHDAPQTRAHAMTNTDQASGIEACSTCHGPGDAFDAAHGHTLDP